MPTLTDRRLARHCAIKPRLLRTPTLLCIDDDPDIQASIEVRLRDYDVKVDHAYFGMQGVSETIKTRPDLILTDLAMPNGDGQYLLNCIKCNSATAGIPVIVLTGMRDPILKGRVLQAGASVFLQKPAQFDDLLHHMCRFIDLRKRGGAGGQS